jgi:C-terminal domain 7 of the ABC-three component (ABC-3C) systems
VTNPARRQAPATAAAFNFQVERALYRLAVSTDREALVGVETDDDVSVMGGREEGEVNEQAKLSTKDQGHPFQDRAVGLWKTLAGWLEAARTGTSHQRDARLILVTNRPVPQDSLARRIAQDPQSEEQVDACIVELRSIALNASASIQSFADTLTSASDQELADLIRRIGLEDASGVTCSNEIRDSIASALHLHPSDDDALIVQILLGWLVTTLQSLWMRREPGWVSRAQFDSQIHAIRMSLKRDRQRERAERLIPVNQGDRESARSKAFVDRLIEIDLGDEDIDLAIDTYVRHSTEKYRLARLGEYVASDWLDFYDDLRTRWETIRPRVRRVADRSSLSPEHHGQMLLDDVVHQDFCGTLAGERTIHLYFTQGGHHRLADEDQVWWHPDYQLETST